MTTLNDINFKINNSWNTLLDIVYPVGSTYIAYTSTSPATRFGGTWTQITGRFLRAANDVSTGGADTVTLDATMIPAHTHTGPSHTHTGPSHSHGLNSHTHTGPSHTHGVGTIATKSDGAHTHTVKVKYDGSSWHNVFCNGSEAAGYGLASTGGFAGRILVSTSGNYPYLTATSAEAHTHKMSGSTGSAGTGATGAASGNTAAAGTGATGAAGTGATGSTGGGKAHNNMPAYQNMYVWRRTA